jgi:hypothetical protein
MTVSKFTDHLWSDLVREHGATLAYTERPAPSRLRQTRSRVLAGSTALLAAIAVAVVLALGGSSAAPAYAITASGDGSVLVEINQLSSLPDANSKLTAMGIHEQLEIFMKPGPATVRGPVECTTTPGVTVNGPRLKVLVGAHGTDSIGGNHTPGVVGVATYHLDHCLVTR